jgi:hypothetical protein
MGVLKTYTNRVANVNQIEMYTKLKSNICTKHISWSKFNSAEQVEQRQTILQNSYY